MKTLRKFRSVFVLFATMSVFWITGYPGPPAPGPLQRPSFGPGVERRPKPAEKTLMRRTTAKTTKGQKASSRAVSHEGRDHIHVSLARFHAEQEDKGRRPLITHATPDREETNFRHACIKRHSGCWLPPKNSVDGAGRQRKTSASSTHSGGPAPPLYEDNVHGRIKTTAVLPPWPCVATPSTR
jgi:hypothetical protein